MCDPAAGASESRDAVEHAGYRKAVHICDRIYSSKEQQSRRYAQRSFKSLLH